MSCLDLLNMANSNNNNNTQMTCSMKYLNKKNPNDIQT